MKGFFLHAATGAISVCCMLAIGGCLQSPNNDKPQINTQTSTAATTPTAERPVETVASAPPAATPTTQVSIVAEPGSVKNISNAELQTLLNEGVTLVDIRLDEEWQQTGVVQNSKLMTLFDRRGNVDPDFFANMRKNVPMDQPVVLICRTGNRTNVGSQMLVQSGYQHVYNVTNGITQWIAEGRPVTKP